MVDIGYNTVERKKIPNRALKTVDFIALTANIVLVTLAALIGIVFFALLLGVPDFALSETSAPFGLVSSIGLSSIIIAPSVIPVVIVANIVSFAMKTFNDSEQHWVFLLSRGARIFSLVTALALITTAITILTTIGVNNN